jgi:ABC-type microcin C transport system permease subunit YejB
MKANQLATLVLRLLGIYCIVEFLPTAGMLTGVSVVSETLENFNQSNLMAIVQASMPSIIWLIMGCLLLIFSVSWGERLAKGINEEKISEISFEKIQILVFAVAGFFLFVGGLSQLFNNVGTYFLFARVRDFTDETTHQIVTDWRSIFSICGSVLQMAIGTWMFFGARGLAFFRGK